MQRRDALWATGLVALTIAGCGSSSGAERVPRAPNPGQPTLRVLTYNVNYGIPGDESTLAAIAKAKADLVLLQETTREWEPSLRAKLSGDYPHARFLHSGGAGGMAVFSKSELLQATVLKPPNGGWFPAWLLRVDSALGPLQVLAVHLRPQLSASGSVVSGVLTTPPVRKREMTSYLEALDGGLPTLVVGDFNEGDRGTAIAVLKRSGYRSALGEFDSSADTWSWPTSVGRVSRRLDHVVYSPELQPLDVRVLKAGRSDHLPVVADLALAPVAAPERSSSSYSPTSW